MTEWHKPRGRLANASESLRAWGWNERRRAHWWRERPAPELVTTALRERRSPTDRVFDCFLPPELRVVSGQYWTPVEVALRVAEWLEHHGARSVVDVGSGAGKLCVAAALAGEACFVGVEHRRSLVEAARDLARALGVEDRVSFVHASLGEAVLPSPDAYYLYNPFGENMFAEEDHLDEEVELGASRFVRDVTIIEGLLREAPVGTLLITYNGFGGDVPSSFCEERVDEELPNVLRLWRKTTVLESGAGRPDP